MNKLKPVKNFNKSAKSFQEINQATPHKVQHHTYE